MQIPISDIDQNALPRDRTLIDTAALEELERSILQTGLRNPIEVWKRDTGYVLIAGLRRLTAYRRLLKTYQLDKFKTIEVTLRTPENVAEAMTMMVEENDIRANLSPWERSAVVVSAVRAEHFDTFDAAINGLFPHADARRVRRIRAIADVVDELGDLLIDPEGHSQQALSRLATALQNGWGPLIEAALQSTRSKDHRAQWQVLKPVLDEHDNLSQIGRQRPNNPKRLSHFECQRRSITLRRETIDLGYLLYITGPGATAPVVRDAMDNIEQMLGPG